jgi:hypothetical protein
MLKAYYLPEREPFTLPSAAVYTFGSERFAFRAGSSVTIASRAPALAASRGAPLAFARQPRGDLSTLARKARGRASPGAREGLLKPLRL